MTIANLHHNQILAPDWLLPQLTILITTYTYGTEYLSSAHDACVVSYVQLWCFEVCVCVYLGISWHFVPWNKRLRAVKRLMLALAGITRVEYRSQNPTWRLGETIIFS